MATTYPFGYAGATRTIDQMMLSKTVWNLHPEMRRRTFALMEAGRVAGVSLGIGTGWRRQPTDKPGFAAPGNSYHEGFMPGGRTRPDGVNDVNALAVDTVLTSAWPWMNANSHRYGLRHFANVNNEPWHIQPFEIPTSRNFATSPPPLVTFNLPDDGTAEEEPMTPQDIATVIKIVEDRIPLFAKAVWAYPINNASDPAGADVPAGTGQSYILRNTADLYQGDAPGSPPTKDYYDQTTALILDAISKVPSGGEGGGLTDAELAKIAKAVNDELHRRQES